MAKREYEGAPLDYSWKSGPWTNDGETVSVPGEVTHEEIALSKTDVDTPIGRTDIDILRYLSENGPSKYTGIVENADCSRKYLNRVYAMYANVGVIEREKCESDARAYVYNSPPNAISRLKRMCEADFSTIPDNIEGLTLTDNQRKIITKRMQFPNASATKISEMVGVSQPTVWRCLDKFDID